MFADFVQKRRKNIIHITFGVDLKQPSLGSYE